MAFSSYAEAIDYLYTNLPMYQRVGAIAYQEDLENTIALCDALGNPEKQFKSVHVAGTNGKGSTSHMLAAVLQCAGYKTGLYTSPHLKEFTERIRINGKEVDHPFIVDFVNRIKPVMDKIKPSFFEITVAMAYDYFARQHVDIAIVEVGLGGRLDSTNVITPVVSVICSIGYDHQNILGDTLEKIAYEKAGIIKPNVPVVISQTQTGVKEVFEKKAAALGAPIFFADQVFRAEILEDQLRISTDDYTLIVPGFPLKGLYQQKNVPGVMMCIDLLNGSNMSIDQAAISEGLARVVDLTSLRGRWQKLNDRPLIICDTGHNPDGIREVVAQIRLEKFDRLFMIIGMVKDKDIKEVLSLLPREAEYFFCEAVIPRALDAELLAGQARDLGLRGIVVKDVNDAIRSAKRAAGPGDFIFVGGSTFVVGEIEGLI